MNCALSQDETCEECSVNSHCAIYKNVIDAFVDSLTHGRPDGTVKALINKNQDIGIIVIKGAAQVANVMKILGEAGGSVIGKRFV